jgi:hypothetical protein
VSDVWVDIVNNRCDTADDLKFSGKELIAAVSRNKVCKSNNIETTLMSNPMGLYKAWYKRRNVENKLVTAVACYATSPNVLLTPPGGNSKWYEDSVSRLPRITGSTEEEKRRDKRCLPDEGLMPTATPASTQKMRRRQEAGLFAVTDDPELPRLSNTNDQVEDTPQETPPLQDQLASDAIRKQSWWESTNAFSLFGELRIDEDDEVAVDPNNSRVGSVKETRSTPCADTRALSTLPISSY